MVYNKYPREFSEMYERHSFGEHPFDIVRGYEHIMEAEGIETMGLVAYFADYLKSQSE